MDECPSGYEPNKYRKCVPKKNETECPFACITCEDSSTCLVCEDGYFEQNGECIQCSDNC